MIDSGRVAANVDEVRNRIAAVAGGREVAVLAVTKGFGADAVIAAHAAGLRSVGENYAQELVAKHAELDGAGEWHFIGRLQRNKVKSLASCVDVWQSVDRAELVDEIARRAPGARVMVQVDLSDEPQKGGASFDDVPALVERAADAGLVVVGLMGVGPAGDPELSRPGFARLVALADRLGLPERSIGMSHDLEVAVEEGSTMVRIGSALFGERPARPRRSPLDSTGG